MTEKLILFCFLLAPVLAGCDKGKAQSQAEQASQSVRLINVEVKTVHPESLNEYLSLTGYSKALHDIIIASEQGGTVQELLADRGSWVTKGQALALVSADIYKAQLAEAEANLRLKDAGLKKASALFERGSITAMQRLQAQVDYDAAAANAEIARSRLDRAEVKAPFDGKIEDRFVDRGEMVPPGGQLFRLVDRRRMKIISELAELDVSTIRSGITAEVHFDAMPDTVFQARLTFVASSALQASRTFPCEFELDNPHEKILGGLHARIRVLKKIHQNVIVLPQTSLVETETGRNIFVLEGDVARKKDVTIGASNNGLVVIASGLQPEETVIITGQRDLVDGQQVRVTSRKD